MQQDLTGNSAFQCSCRRPIGTCNDLNHPVKMDAVVGPFVEGWALGKYSGKLVEKSTIIHTEYGKLKYGKLVHDYKYQSFKLNEPEGRKLRNSINLEIFKAVDYFLDGYFPLDRRHFDTVLAVPSSSGSETTIQNDICAHLNGNGLRLARKTILVHEKGTISTKNIEGFRARSKSVEQRFERGDDKDLIGAKGLLLIDDIYETSATLRTTVKILNTMVPLIPKYFLTVAYIT